MQLCLFIQYSIPVYSRLHIHLRFLPKYVKPVAMPIVFNSLLTTLLFSRPLWQLIVKAALVNGSLVSRSDARYREENLTIQSLLT